MTQHDELLKRLDVSHTIKYLKQSNYNEHIRAARIFEKLIGACPYCGTWPCECDPLDMGKVK